MIKNGAVYQGNAKWINSILIHTVESTAVHAQSQCAAKPVALTGSRLVLEVYRRRNSLVADANPIPCTLVAAHAVSAIAPRGKTWRIASIALIIHAKDTAHGKQRQSFVPHSREAASSLEAIKRDGVASWLAAQKKRWSCPDCGSPFSWYALECYKCGRSLASKAYQLSGWRKLLCRFVLPMAYRKGKAKSRSV